MSIPLKSSELSSAYDQLTQSRYNEGLLASGVLSSHID